MKRQWETEELVEHWTCDIEDRALLGNKTGATRLGFAVLLKFFRREGRFPQYKNEVPGIVTTHLSTQVGVDASAYMQYAWQGRTIEYHRAQIRGALGFRESTIADAEQMQQWLIAEVLPQEHQVERPREQVYAWFRRRHLEVPTPDRLTRLIRSAAHTFEQRFYETTLARLPEETQAALEWLLSSEIAAPEGGTADGEVEWEHAGQAQHVPQDTQAQAAVTFHQLRMDPGRVGLATMLEEMAKMRRIRKLQLPDDLFPGIARRVLAVYRNRASVEEPSRLRAHSKAKRLTYLAALCFLRAQEITDGWVDLLVPQNWCACREAVEAEYLNEFKRVANKEGMLYRIAEASVTHPDELVREVVFPV